MLLVQGFVLKTPKFSSLNIALLSISDSRSLEDDTSGETLASLITQSGHSLADRLMSKDNRYEIRAKVSAWIANPAVQVIITSGGTGFTGRDTTPEALLPLFDKLVEGFGELFRSLSFQEIGASTIQSRALAGVANGTFIFCLPGSTNACKTAWEMILKTQLDARSKPCNFVDLMPRLKEVS